MQATTTAHLKSIRNGVGLVMTGWVGLAIWNLVPPVASVFGAPGQYMNTTLWIGVCSAIGLVGGILTLIGNGTAMRAPADIRAGNHIARIDAKQAMSFTVVGIVAYLLAIIAAGVGGAVLADGNFSAFVAQFTSAEGPAITFDAALARLTDPETSTPIIAAATATLGFGLIGVGFTLAGIFKFQRFCATSLASFNEPKVIGVWDAFVRMRTFVGVYVALGVVAILAGSAFGVASVREAVTLDAANAVGLLLVGVWYLALLAVFIFQFAGLGGTVSGLNRIEQATAAPREDTTPATQPAKKKRGARDGDGKRGAA